MLITFVHDKIIARETSKLELCLIADIFFLYDFRENCDDKSFSTKLLSSSALNDIALYYSRTANVNRCEMSDKFLIKIVPGVIVRQKSTEISFKVMFHGHNHYRRINFVK